MLKSKAPLMALIPHAGFPFAGKARKSVFQEVSNGINDTKRPIIIFYLAAVHHVLNREESQFVYIDIPKKDNELLSKLQPLGKLQSNFVIDSKFFPDAILEEHSYKWVKPEIQQVFPGADIFVFYISPSSSSLLQTHFIEWFAKMIQHNINIDNNVLILGTTDLTHYGPSYDSKLHFPFPQQLYKQEIESPLILSLVDNNFDLFVRTMKRTPFIADAPQVLATMIHLAHIFNLRGNVVDYYDSSSISQPLTMDKNGWINDELDRYTISFRPVTEFVSYVGIVWLAGDLSSTIFSNFDIMQAIGAVRTIIGLYTITGGQNLLTSEQMTNILPSWSVWRKSDVEDFGSFVGTQSTQLQRGIQELKTNCSYGRFPNTPLLLADKIIESAKNCWEDAAYRWKMPYTLKDLQTFGRIVFKVELLEPIKLWKWVEGHNLLPIVKEWMKYRHDEKYDESKGLQLIVPKVGSATFLPSVVKDWPSIKKDWPSTEQDGDNNGKAALQYLNALSEKLGGNFGDWAKKGSIAGIYDTIVFRWDPYSQSIISK